MRPRQSPLQPRPVHRDSAKAESGGQGASSKPAAHRSALLHRLIHVSSSTGPCFFIRMPLGVEPSSTWISAPLDCTIRGRLSDRRTRKVAIRRRSAALPRDTLAANWKGSKVSGLNPYLATLDAMKTATLLFHGRSPLKSSAPSRRSTIAHSLRMTARLCAVILHTTLVRGMRDIRRGPNTAAFGSRSRPSTHPAITRE